MDAFEQLVQAYQGKVFNIALSIMGNRADADDAAQEAFIKIYRSIGAFHFHAQFSTWLYRVATNVCLDCLRRRKRAGAASLDGGEDGEEAAQLQVPDTGPTPEEAYGEKETVLLVRQAIGKLHAEHQKVIILRDINGLSYEEIAKIERCSVGTVKSRISRARNNLKKLLEKNREQFL